MTWADERHAVGRSFLQSPDGPSPLRRRRAEWSSSTASNVVYKHPPYIAYPDPGQPWDLKATRTQPDDAEPRLQRGASRGSSSAGPRAGVGRSQPAPDLHARGTRRNPPRVQPGRGPRPYLAHVKATVDLFDQRHGISTLLDMHQDVYDENFRGEGAPDWAVCTDNVPIVPVGGPVVEQLLEFGRCRPRWPTSGPTTWWATCRAISTRSGRQVRLGVLGR